MTTSPAHTSVSSTSAVGKGVVLFDGDCRFCQLSVKMLRNLDWLGSFHFQSARETDQVPVMEPPLETARMLEEMHVVTPDRRRAYAGFSAFRWMAWRMPFTLPMAPFLYLPGVLWAGNRVYRWIARNRFDLVPCHDGQCVVPLKKKP
ncbi:MAG: thiol-disulfide oxidoreductase DCC family protein [Fimbriiglobus sp.]